MRNGIHYIVNNELEFTRKELEAYLIEILEDNPSLIGTLRNFLPQYDIKHNARVSACRLMRELGFTVIYI